MARPGRPVSESYQSVCCSVIQSSSTSSEAAIVGLEEDDQAPIFSISKSSMDVVMATGPPNKRDPAWTRLDLRRSSSTNTHSEQSSVTLQQLHPHMWQKVSSTNSPQLQLTAQIVDVRGPPAPGECRTADTQRWSKCSFSTHSRSSTPDTVVWKGGSSRPLSLSQEACCPSALDSPMSKPASPPATPSPVTSPLHTPTLPPVDLSAISSPLTLGTNQQEDFLVSSPAPSPLLSPLQAHTSSTSPSNSPHLLLLTSTEEECFLESNLPSFHFPSPKTSPVRSVEQNTLSDVGCLDNFIEEPGDSDGGGVRSPEQVFSFFMPLSLGQSCPTQAGRRSSLVSSLSDSRLVNLCRCHLMSRDDITKPPRFQLFREEGTMTSTVELVNAEVQTDSPIGSWWHLKRNMSTSMGSHSILGSPPGSKLNLKSSVGSNSNLVSPSSSMFPVSSGEEEEGHGEDLRWDNNSASSHDLERRRSCLKIQGEQRDELGRRSSMKQVQWDEDGMTWEVHGASLDPVELSMAIQKHLDLQKSPQPLKRSSKKKRAPMPPIISSVVKAMAPELNPTVTINVPSCIQEGGSGEAVEEEEEDGGGKKEETAAVPRRRSRAEGEDTKEEEDEVYGAEDSSCPKSPSGLGGPGRKRGVIRSLRRPRWCGGSRKTND